MERPPVPVLKPGSFWSALLPYSLIYFFISLGDAIMSYVTPVYIESHVANATIMGLVISASSVVGIMCDFLFAKVFKNKPFIFFIWAAVICAALFPVSFRIFPPTLLTFLLGMAIWGVYYELLQFSDFNFIKQTLSVRAYSGGWGTLGSFKATSYFLGPILAGWLISKNPASAFTGALGFTLVAAIILFFYSLDRPKHHQNSNHEQIVLRHYSWVSEIKVWLSLIIRIWPVYIFIFLLYLIDSTFWTIGTLFSEELRLLHPAGGLILPAYSLPTLFMGLVIGRLFPPTGKKRLAYITAGIAGLLLAAVGLVTHPLLIVGIVFLSSVSLSISFPEICAVFEDYVCRLGAFGNEMIGLQSSAISLAYIIGPIVAGALATVVGNHLTFTVMGLLLFLYSILAIIFTPKKIHLPQTELQSAAK